MELSCTGEVLTSDEVLERIEKADADSEARKRGKGKKGKSTKQCIISPLRHPNMGHPDAQRRVPMSLVKVVEQHTQWTKQTVGLDATIVSHGGTTGVQDFPICSPQR